MPTAVGDELAIVDSWIASTLAANATITSLAGSRIYLEAAPTTVEVYPFIVYQMETAEDLRVVNGFRVWTDTVYIVKAIAQTSTYTDMVDIGAAIDAALTSSVGGSVSIPNPGGAGTFDGMTFACIRERPFRLLEIDQGVAYRHVGGAYRIYAQAA